MRKLDDDDAWQKRVSSLLIMCHFFFVSLLLNKVTNLFRGKEFVDV
jgi:hypothetical protein